MSSRTRGARQGGPSGVMSADTATRRGKELFTLYGIRICPVAMRGVVERGVVQPPVGVASLGACLHTRGEDIHASRHASSREKKCPTPGTACMDGMADGWMEGCRLPTTTSSSTTTTACSSSCNGPAPQQVTLEGTGPKRGRRGIRERVLVGLWAGAI